jgi:hypothetical protein
VAEWEVIIEVTGVGGRPGDTPLWWAEGGIELFGGKEFGVSRERQDDGRLSGGASRVGEGAG